MLVYIISEESILTADSLRLNQKLEILIYLRAKYKIPLILLLTHSDDYCDKVKKEDQDWKRICCSHFNDNKQNLLKYVNELIKKKFNSNFLMNENDIMHIVLVEGNQINQISDEELIKQLPKKIKDKYDKADKEKDEKRKKEILEDYRDIIESKENEVIDFIREEIKVLGQKELIEKLKNILPMQYHDVFNPIN